MTKFRKPGKSGHCHFASEDAEDGGGDGGQNPASVALLRLAAPDKAAVFPVTAWRLSKSGEQLRKLHNRKGMTEN